MGFLGRKGRSAQNAKDRLQLVLVHDRTDITPAVLDELKDDLLAVISQHIEIDPGAVRIDIARDGRSQRLVADIPLRSSTTRRRTG
ncbi:MAG: cell division topological specificity factor MinE [Anaerolineales bacterium]|nr:cell division topological specificity factor MinE [Anaerolineales bacterium]